MEIFKGLFALFLGWANVPFLTDKNALKSIDIYRVYPQKMVIKKQNNYDANFLFFHSVIVATLMFKFKPLGNAVIVQFNKPKQEFISVIFAKFYNRK